MATNAPQTIDPSYTPTTSIKSLPANAPIQEILEVIERDGGIILTGLVSAGQLTAVDEEVEAFQKSAPSTENSALHIIPKETLVVPGLVGKSQTMAEICELPVLDQLRASILQEQFTVIREDFVEENSIDPLLSISCTLHIGYGAQRQRLHRDDNVHGIRHADEFNLQKSSQLGCLIAGTKTTRKNGATMFIPGSHKWDDERRPKMEEICFAGKLILSQTLLSHPRCFINTMKS
jgi:ectoine hydroxylase-related dioxygenase (phytanoyl-CoA dioxygenase family)